MIGVAADAGFCGVDSLPGADAQPDRITMAAPKLSRCGRVADIPVDLIAD